MRSGRGSIAGQHLGEDRETSRRVSAASKSGSLSSWLSLL
jgi:hypothetical protein